MTMDDELLTEIAGQVGAPYLMTAEQVLTQLVMGGRRHGDAPDGVCGMVDPRWPDERYWCVRPPGHDDNHNSLDP